MKVALGFPGGSVVKNPPTMQETPDSAGDIGLISGSGRSPEDGNGISIYDSCLGHPTNRGTW